MHGLFAGGPLDERGEAVDDGEDQAAHEVAGQAHEQDPQPPPRRDAFVVVADDHHHHIAGEQFGLRVVDEHERGPEGERPERLADARH